MDIDGYLRLKSATEHLGVSIQQPEGGEDVQFFGIEIVGHSTRPEDILNSLGRAGLLDNTHGEPSAQRPCLRYVDTYSAVERQQRELRPVVIFEDIKASLT